MMMTFCKKSEHPLLGFPYTKDNETVNKDSSLHHPHHHNSTTASGGVNPFTVSTNCLSTDAFESTAVKSSIFASTMDTSIKRDPGGIGFIDDVGGSVDGLMSCTESLGFESSDERRVHDQIGNLNDIEEFCSRKKSLVCSKWKREHVKREIKKFPPPLSSLNQNGKPTFFLRPVRKDGKLELKEVKISRPEIMRASRQDGRLRLHLICNEDEYIEEQSEEEEEEEEVEGETMGEIQEDVQEMVEKKMGENMQEMVEKNNENEEEEAEENDEENVEGWQIPASSGGGEGFLRCHEQVSHHHHHHELHVWRQHFVTIR